MYRAFTFVWRPEKKVRRGTEYDDMLILLTTIVMLAARWISFSRYVDSRFEVFSYPVDDVVRPPLCSIDVILRAEDNTFVLVSIKCTYPHAPLWNIVTISKFSVNYVPQGKPSAGRHWESLEKSQKKLAREEAVNDSRYQSPRWRKRSPRVLPLTKTFLRKIVTWRFLRTIQASRYSSLACAILNRTHQISKIFWRVDRSPFWRFIFTSKFDTQRRIDLLFKCHYSGIPVWSLLRHHLSNCRFHFWRDIEGAF